MLNKREARAKRAKRTRSKICQLEMIRLCVHRTPRHVYAQITSFDGAKTLATASTLDEEVAKGLKSTGNVDAAKAVGALVAKRALKAGIKTVAFDRSGYRYHGRIKALADAARESGLEF